MDDLLLSPDIIFYPSESIDRVQTSHIPPSIMEIAPWYVNATLTDLLNRFVYLPLLTSLLGVVESGLPIFIDLEDSQSASFLVIGDSHTGKADLIRSMCESAMVLSTKDVLEFIMVTDYPEKYQSMRLTAVQRKNRFDLLSYDESVLENKLSKMIHLVKDRQLSGEKYPQIWFVWDDLLQFEHMPVQIFQKYAWLLVHGPQTGVISLAVLDTTQADQVPEWINLFQTRIVGPIIANPIFNRIILSGDRLSRSLIPGRQFVVNIEKHWVKFWSPNPEK